MTTNSSINAPKITAGGAVTFSGANSFTGTITGATSVTFPTSGTLATTAGSGALTWLASRTASNSATIDFASLLSSTYDNYLVTIENLLPASNAVTFQLQVGTGAGPTYQATNYSANAICYSPGTYSSGTTALDLTVTSRTSNTASRVGSGCIYIFDVNGANDKTVVSSVGVWDSTLAADNFSYLGGRWQSSTVITSLRFLMSSGNISTGIFKLYGITN